MPSAGAMRLPPTAFRLALRPLGRNGNSRYMHCTSQYFYLKTCFHKLQLTRRARRDLRFRRRRGHVPAASEGRPHGFRGALRDACVSFRRTDQCLETYSFRCNGRAAYEIGFGVAYRGAVLPFGEVALFRHSFAPGGRKAGGSVGSLRFERGAFVGESISSNEIKLFDTDGRQRAAWDEVATRAPLSATLVDQKRV